MSRTTHNTRVALAAASFLALLEIFRTGMTSILEGEHASVFDLIHWVLPLWLTVVLLSPWCAWMAVRFPMRTGQLSRTLAVHVGGAAVFVALHLALLNLIHHVMALTHGFFPGPQHLLHRYVFYVGMEMSVYAAIVVVVMLLEARREAAERTVAAAKLERTVAAARSGEPAEPDPAALPVQHIERARGARPTRRRRCGGSGDR